VNTFANSRTAFASLRGKPYPCYAIPLKAGMSIGMMLISVELLLMLFILLFIPGDYAGPASSASRSANRWARPRSRIAGGHLHEDRRHRVGPDEDRLQDQGRRRAQPRRHRGLHGRQRGRLGRPRRPTASRPTASPGVALISFILLAVSSPTMQVQLLVWIFMMRIVMVVASGVSYLVNEALARRSTRTRQDELRGAADAPRLAHLVVSIALTYARRTC
jgi:K(+)-stimulated pyrophosphate-energized sodium pump